MAPTPRKVPVAGLVMAAVFAGVLYASGRWACSRDDSSRATELLPVGVDSPPPRSEPEGPAPTVSGVLVRSAEDGAPLPGCVVLWTRSGGLFERAVEDLLALAEDPPPGRRLFADASGRVALPKQGAASGGALVLATFDRGRFGAIAVDDLAAAGGAEPVLSARRIAPLLLVAETESGRGLPGIEVEVQARGGGRQRRVAGGTSGPGGRVELGLAPMWLESGFEELLVGARATSGEAAIVVGRGQVADGHRLVFPDCGSVEVLLLGPDGRPFGETEVGLRSLEELRGRQPRFVVPSYGGEGVGGGVTRFDGLPLGLRLEASATWYPPPDEAEGRVGSPPEPLRAVGEVEGPVADGQVVRVELRLDERPALVGRAVDTRLAPIGGHLEIRWVRDDGAGWNDFFEPDPDGAFRIPASEWGFASGELRVAFLTGRPSEPAGALLRLSLPLEPGANDLGLVTLLSPVRLASLRVRDTRGEPIEARISHVANDGPWPSAFVLLQGRSLEAGVLEVWGHPEAGPRLECWVSTLHHGSRRVACDVGTEGLEVVFGAREPRSLTGTVRVDPGVPATLLRVVLTRERGTLRFDPPDAATVSELGLSPEQIASLLEEAELEMSAPKSSARVAANGSFRFDDLMFATFALEVTLDGENAPCLALAELVYGPETEPLELDLTGVLWRHRFTVLDPAGTPASGLYARVDARSSQPDAWVEFDGTIVLLASTPTMDLSLRASDDAEPRTYRAVGGDTALVLGR